MPCDLNFYVSHYPLNPAPTEQTDQESGTLAGTCTWTANKDQVELDSAGT